jgi:hypothetical protein
MHSSPLPDLPVGVDAPASTAVPEARPSAPRLATHRAALERCAESELEAYFARKRKAAPRTAEDEVVAATLASISAYHQGVLKLYYDGRTWPEEITKALGAYASIGIRLDCAHHPAMGSTPILEHAAAERITAIVASKGFGADSISELVVRAMEHHDRALHGYMKALRAREAR